MRTRSFAFKFSLIVLFVALSFTPLWGVASAASPSKMEASQAQAEEIKRYRKLGMQTR